jgi:AcrR family transcriptional regulator
VQDIAAAAGYTTGAIYSSFNGKDDLFLAVYRRRSEQQWRVWRETLETAKTSKDAPAAMGAALEKATFEPAWYAAVFEFYSYAGRHPELRHETAEIMRRMDAVMMEILSDVSSRSGLSLERLAPIVVGLIRGLAWTWFVDPDAADTTLFSDGVRVLIGASDGDREGADGMTKSVRGGVDLASTHRQVGIVDLASYREVVLDAPIEQAWRRALDYASWQGYTSLEHVSGPVDAEGEVKLIRKPETELVWQPKYVRTVKLDPPHQVIFTIYSGGNTSDWEHQFTGTVEYRLTETGDGRTRFAFQCIKEYQVPYEEESELDEVRRREYELQKTYEDSIFPNLEALVSQR